MKKTFLFLAAGMIAFAACNKDDNDDNSKTPAEHLKAGKWFLAAETEREQGNGKDTTYDYMSEYEACELDNYMLFTNDSVTNDNGATKCSPSEAQILHTAVWSLIDNNSKLVLKFPGGSDTIGVSVLNATTLELKDVEIENDVTYTFIQRYKH